MNGIKKNNAINVNGKQGLDRSIEANEDEHEEIKNWKPVFLF